MNYAEKKVSWDFTRHRHSHFGALVEDKQCIIIAEQHISFIDNDILNTIMSFSFLKFNICQAIRDNYNIIDTYINIICWNLFVYAFACLGINKILFKPTTT